MKKSKKKSNILVKILGFFIIAIVIVFAVAFVVYSDSLNAVDPSNESMISYEVKEGSSISTIGPELYDIDLIKSSVTFSLAARVSNKVNIAAGTYNLSQSMDVNQILSIITDPTQAVANEVIVTLKEGFWAKDMAEEIASKCNVTAQEMIDTWNDLDFFEELKSEYWFITDDMLNDGQRVILEGYLYPDTYYFDQASDAKIITYKILDRFEEVINPYKEEIDNFEIGGEKQSLYDVITLASIVQYESSDYKEMPIIAGVFVNRLNDGMRLQSSVTVCYMLYNFEDWSECELYSNQEIQSPYNTYTSDGLPLGPILNPSNIAIEGVLNYEDTDYYYFIGGSDGNVYYAESFAEHLDNIERYLD